MGKLKIKSCIKKRFRITKKRSNGKVCIKIKAGYTYKQHRMLRRRSNAMRSHKRRQVLSDVYTCGNIKKCIGV